MNPYDVLGVSPDADDKVIKQAYRKAAKDAHPDRDGGSEEQMQLVNAAYDILSDPTSRAHYDEYGRLDGSDPIEELLEQIFNVIIVEKDYRGDLIDKARALVTQREQFTTSARQQAIKDIARLERLSGRIQGAAFNRVLDQHLAKERDTVERADADINLLMKMRERLIDYADTRPEHGHATKYEGNFVTPTFKSSPIFNWDQGS